MSDWELVENFVRVHGYQPKNVEWKSYVACMILHYEGDCEESESRGEDVVDLITWLDLMDENYRFEDFDY